jgi:hypothetical protein
MGGEELAALERAVDAATGLEEAIGDYYRAAVAADAVEREAMLAALDGVMRGRPSERVSFIAVLAGAIVEDGADPRAYPAAVFDHLVELLGLIDGEDDEAELPAAFYDLERGAMACLSRSSQLRRALPQKAALEARICRYQERYGFLGKMLAVLDGEPLLVLHPSTSRGFRFEISGIADNFELHRLLLEVLAGGGPDEIQGVAPSADADAVASDWQLANWFALRPGGTIDTKNYHESWIWNEGVPADIACFEGLRIVLIGPSTIQRSWDAGRVFSAMVGTLEAAGSMDSKEVEALLARLMVAANAP